MDEKAILKDIMERYNTDEIEYVDSAVIEAISQTKKALIEEIRRVLKDWDYTHYPKECINDIRKKLSQLEAKQ